MGGIEVYDFAGDSAESLSRPGEKQILRFAKDDKG
jgi:hypothetical protein